MNPNSNSFNGGGDGSGMYGKPFALSAAAPEFVPRHFAMNEPSNGMPVFQPQQQQVPQMQQYALQQQQQIQESQYQLQQTVLHHQQQAQQQAQQQHHFNAQQRAAQATAMQQNYPSNYGYQSQRHQPRGPPSHRGSSHQNQQQAAGPHDAMAQLKQAILIMTKDPSTFDEKMPELTSTLAASIENEEKLIKMVEEIFRQSTEEANFRYTGARICNYFSHHLTVANTTQSFKQHLLRRCQEEHSKREDLVENCDNRYKLIGFVLFMGEVLLNTNEFEKDADSIEYIKILSKGVQELLLTLLSQPADDTLRCVVQVIKLCGGVQEDTEKLVTPDEATPHLDRIYEIIKTNILESSYIKSLRAQMLSVIELRASDWGRQESSRSQSSGSTAPPPPPQPPIQVPNYNAVPVNAANMYYNDPSQQNLQQPNMPGFGSSGFYPEDMYLYSSGDEDYTNQEDMYYMYNGAECLQPEDDMDPEIAAAFEEFLKNQAAQQQ